MKKLFALVIALGAMTAVFAQRGYDHGDESRDVILGQGNRSVYDHRGGDNGYYSVRERDEQIERINREYNWRIESVKHDRYLRKADKRHQIRILENERDARIREVMSHRHNRYHDRDYRNDDDRDYRNRRY